MQINQNHLQKKILPKKRISRPSSTEKQKFNHLTEQNHVNKCKMCLRFYETYKHEKGYGDCKNTKNLTKKDVKNKTYVTNAQGPVSINQILILKEESV